MINPGDYIIIQGIETPDWLLNAMFAEEELKRISNEDINKFIRNTLRPKVIEHHPDADSKLFFVSGHVHVGTEGVTAHDHLPYSLTSILYLVDAEGQLIIDPDGESLRITPSAGMMVVIRGTVVHSVEVSPVNELRAALVANYFLKSQQMECLKNE